MECIFWIFFGLFFYVLANEDKIWLIGSGVIPGIGTCIVILLFSLYFIYFFFLVFGILINFSKFIKLYAKYLKTGFKNIYYC